MIHIGDCREIMRGMAENSIDAMVTDPPYGLSKEPDMAEVLRHWLAGDDYTHSGGGFMGKSWDSFVPGPATWREALRVLKPGGHGLVFAGSRTQDLMSISLRLAGFEIRDSIRYFYDPEEELGGGGLAWIYGSGFPKSLNIGNGWGTALKPAYEPIILVRKPFPGTVADNVLTWGTGGLNIDGCRIGPGDRILGGGANFDAWRTGEERADRPSQHGKQQSGHDKGRWPANIMHDGSVAVLAGFPGESGRFFYCPKTGKADRNGGCEHLQHIPAEEMTGGRAAGSAGLESPRAGAGRTSGAGNSHPTVKPTELMRYLCRLITPAGGLVLDPFAGSGSTGKAAILEEFLFVGCELSTEYATIAQARIDHALYQRFLMDVTEKD